MQQNEKLKLCSTMMTYGGSFVQALAECIIRADVHNLARLQKAFPEYFKKYGKEGTFQKEGEE